MSTKIAFGLLLVFMATVSTAFAQATAVIYDPLVKASEENFTQEDEDLVEAEVVPKIKTKWSKDDSCDGSNLTIIGAVEGSFTKKAAAQRAIVYEMCQTGNGLANNGIAIVENGKVIVNFVAEGGWNVDVARVADIDKNGYDELVIQTGGGMHQGCTGSSADVIEVSETAVKSFRTFLTYSNECENPKPDQFCDRSFKITVRPGPKPSFYSQKYINKSDEDEPEWVASGKAKGAKSLARVTTNYTLVK